MPKSKIFLLSCLSFIAGIFLSGFLNIDQWILLLLMSWVIAAAYIFKKDRKTMAIFFCLLFILSGLFRAQSVAISQEKLSKIMKCANQKMVLGGTIGKEPEIKNGKQKLILGNIHNIGSVETRHCLVSTADKILIYADKYPEYRYGDVLKISTKLKIPESFDGFDYQNYLFSQSIYYLSYYPKIEFIGAVEAGRDPPLQKKYYAQILSFKKNLIDLNKSIYSQPQASIINAMVLGNKTEISQEVLENFNLTGTRHIVAISGLHITIITIMLMYLLLAVGINRNRAFYLAVLLIAFFVIMIGLPPSAIRAAVMGGMVLLAIKVGRLNNSLNAIVFAAAAMLLINPNLLWHNVGFQLSFAAVLGIVYLFPVLEKYSEKIIKNDLVIYRFIRSIILITLSAQIATLPILINSFESLSLSSILANVLILPLVPAVILGSFLVMLISNISLFFGQIISWPIWLAVTYQMKIIEHLAGFSWSAITIKNFPAWAFGIYYLLLAIFLAKNGKTS
jgi:competence protein ComEC